MLSHREHFERPGAAARPACGPMTLLKVMFIVTLALPACDSPGMGSPGPGQPGPGGDAADVLASKADGHVDAAVEDLGDGGGPASNDAGHELPPEADAGTDVAAADDDVGLVDVSELDALVADDAADGAPLGDDAQEVDGQSDAVESPEDALAEGDVAVGPADVVESPEDAMGEGDGGAPDTDAAGGGDADVSWEDVAEPDVLGPACGDGQCAAGESCDGCPEDCGACPDDACCTASAAPGCVVGDIEACVCAKDSYCCTTAWDSYCVDEVDEFGCGTCGAACGDDVCDDGEDCLTCSGDCGACPPDPCGDGLCGTDEDCVTCSADCGVCPPKSCGDGYCGAGESCATCPGDCGACGQGDCCAAQGTPGCGDPVVQGCVCAVDEACCTGPWSEWCAFQAEVLGCAECQRPECTGSACELADPPLSVASLHIQEDTTWSGHVEVGGWGVQVVAGATLTLSPGTRVRFHPAAGLSSFGSVLVAGEPGNPVVLEAADPATPWPGVRTNGDGDIVMAHTLVRDATIGLLSRDFAVSHSRFVRCGVGIETGGDTSTSQSISEVEVAHGGTGIVIEDQPIVSLHRVFVHHNTGAGVVSSDATTLSDSIIAANDGPGILLTGYGGGKLTGNTLAYNGREAVRVVSQTPGVGTQTVPKVNGNNIVGNSALFTTVRWAPKPVIDVDLPEDSPVGVKTPTVNLPEGGSRVEYMRVFQIEKPSALYTDAYVHDAAQSGDSIWWKSPSAGWYRDVRSLDASSFYFSTNLQQGSGYELSFSVPVVAYRAALGGATPPVQVTCLKNGATTNLNDNYWGKPPEPGDIVGEPNTASFALDYFRTTFSDTPHPLTPTVPQLP